MSDEWKFVPVKMTEAMFLAADDEDVSSTEEMWAKALAASPAPLFRVASTHKAQLAAKDAENKTLAQLVVATAEANKAKDAENAELKAQIDASHAVGYRQGAADMCKTKDAEIVRLREALEKIATQKTYDELIPIMYDETSVCFEEGYDAIIEIARAALKEDTNG